MSVVVAYAPTRQGRAALLAADREARRRGLDLVVASHGYADPDRGRRVADEHEVRTDLATLQGANPSPVGASPVARVRLGGGSDVGEFLLDVAALEEAHLLVIALRAKSPIGKLSLGAAARRVVLGAGCPVLAVKDA